MAYSYISYSADGSTNTFAAPVYISKSHVAVTVDGVATTFTWPTLSTVTLTDTAASLAGKVVEVRRTTPRTTRLVDFQDAANVTESMLDTSALQQFYISQEVLDDTADKLTLASDSAYDALTHKIKNLADGTADQDAVTFAQLTAAALSPVAPNATSIAVTPAGSIAATNVQAALEEVATEAASATAAKVTKHVGTVDNLAILSASGEIGDSGINKLVRYEAVRQTVVAGAVDANGQANFLSAGTGLAVSMAATTTPVTATFAAGEDEYGQKNFRKRFTATEADYWSGLAASNVSYLMLERDTSTGVVSAYKTLMPPQYGAFFDKTKQAQLDFDTDFTDLYANTWAAVGNAAVSGGKLALDGTGDGLRNVTIASLGGGSWTLEGDYNYTALPTAGASMNVFCFANASNYGAALKLYNQAGVTKLTTWLSSNGTSDDIASATLGTKTTWATATKYHFALTFDAVAGKYFVYVDGVLDQTVVSTSKICAVTTCNIGCDGNGNGSQNGTIDNFRLSPCCRYPGGTTFTAPTLPFTADAEWFDLSEFKWKYGSPTSWAEKQRVCVGEVTTNATVPTSVTTYALRGKYECAWVTPLPAVSTKTSKTHNLGLAPQDVSLQFQNITAEGGFVPGDQVRGVNADSAGELMAVTPAVDRLTLSFATGSSYWRCSNRTTGAAQDMTAAKWAYRVVAVRGW